MLLLLFISLIMCSLNVISMPETATLEVSFHFTWFICGPLQHKQVNTRTKLLLQPKIDLFWRLVNKTFWAGTIHTHKKKTNEKKRCSIQTFKLYTYTNDSYNCDSFQWLYNAIRGDEHSFYSFQSSSFPLFGYVGLSRACYFNILT